ncbi:glycosyltransferase family 4 protein [Prevotella copri]|uniref:Glycosyltransferase family 4 protein n=1 Tax=Segatella copri TaxID=165179 RepID=A0A6G1U078_9BACT|nr:glycosyltransferase [Segatella copri]MQN80952.1 glycosyltransferase family 4 protein [Segatella copri]
MNILFLMKCYAVGGIEVVTATLASCFARHGHKVVIATFEAPEALTVARTDDSVKIYTLWDYKCTNQNIVALRNLLIEHQIQVVINQWGLPLVSCRVLNKAKKGLKVKTIAVYHNQVDTNARIKNVEIALEGCVKPLKRSLLKLKKAAFKFVTSRSMAYVYHHTDIYQVLSPSYIPLFSKFTGINHPNHLMVQTNPVTLESSDFSYSFDKKEKEIIYMGRIDYNQKRVYRVIDTWAKLEAQFPDWRLTIVGDGVERKNVEQQVADYGLQHVTFEGFQQPKPYYERASILLLTSEYEGFPLVLAESMSFGVIPVVYNSYSAVGDIINDGENGLVIPYHKDGYRTDEAANLLSNLMNDAAKREVMALTAIEKSKEYSVERIYEQWLETLK